MTDAIQRATVASESGHWYDFHTRSQVETVTGSKGQPVKPDLRHARKLQLCRGITSVLRLAHKPQLERWKIEQGILCALTLTRNAGETDREFVARVYEDSKRQAQDAADRGSEIHGAIERAMRGEGWSDDMTPWVDGFRHCLDGAFGPQYWASEKVAVSRYGYGTKIDLCSKRIVLDIKTKAGPASAAALYDEHHEQIAAGRVAGNECGLCDADADGGIVFVSRDTDLDGGKIAETRKPAQVVIAMSSTAQMEAGWRRFRALLTYGFEKDGYRPDWAKD